MTKLQTFTILAASVVAMSSSLCFGTTIITANEDFSSGQDGWTAGSITPVSTTVGVGSDISQGNYLSLTFGDSSYGYASLSTANAAFTGGSMLTNAGHDVSFKFKDISGEPAELGLYFSSQNGDQWGLALWTTPASGQEPTSAWTTYTVSKFPTTAGWYDLTGLDQGSLASDMASVASFGVYLSGGNNQVFGLDDMQLSYSVPEPETIWLILAALASLGITYRSRLSDAARGLVKRS